MHMFGNLIQLAKEISFARENFDGISLEAAGDFLAGSAERRAERVGAGARR